MGESKGLHFIHLNVRSFLPKLDEIRILARKTKTATIGITETWLDHIVTDSKIHVDDYSVLRNDQNRQGGGVCVFIREDLAFNPRSDLKQGVLEVVWTEILLQKTVPILVEVC